MAVRASKQVILDDRGNQTRRGGHHHRDTVAADSDGRDELHGACPGSR
jgi:hypothetical protein